jgi:hypothetical protein
MSEEQQNHYGKLADNIDKKIEQLKARKQQLLSKVKDKERKERTRRLIQIGAIMDSIGITTIEDAENLKKQLLSQEKKNNAD